MEEQGGGVDLEAVLGELKARVAERRAAGEYPEALEAQLSEHFERVMAHRKQDPRPEEPYLDELVDQLEERSRFHVPALSYESHFPGGEKLRRTIGELVRRQEQETVDQLLHYTNLINILLRMLAHLAQEPPYHFHQDMWTHVDGMLQRMADAERVEAGGPAATAALVARVEALEAEVATLRASTAG